MDDDDDDDDGNDDDDDDDDDDDNNNNNLIHLQLQGLENVLARLGFDCMPTYHEYGYTVLQSLNITSTTRIATEEVLTGKHCLLLPAGKHSPSPSPTHQPFTTPTLRLQIHHLSVGT